MVKSKTSLILVVALLFLSSAAIAQTSESAESSDLGDGVASYNFVMQGLPEEASDGGPANAGEVDSERSFERNADDDESFNITQEEALEIAQEELGSREWELDDSERSDGLYEFEFVRGDSEAEVAIDGSSREVVQMDAEVEWESEGTDASVTLSGFIEFNRSGFEVDSDVEVNEESGEVVFDVEIEEEESEDEELEEMRVPVRESEEVEPGNYRAALEVTRDGEVVYNEFKDLNIPETEDSDESEESEDEDSESFEDMSREELIDEIKELREQVERLRQQVSERPDVPEPDTPVNSGEDTESPNEGNESSDLPDEAENADRGNSESGQDNETEGRPSEAPGNSENRPGFVNRMLSGLFG